MKKNFQRGKNRGDESQQYSAKAWKHQFEFEVDVISL
jgi:hypothetical protein